MGTEWGTGKGHARVGAGGAQEGLAALPQGPSRPPHPSVYSEEFLTEMGGAQECGGSLVEVDIPEIPVWW